MSTKLLICGGRDFEDYKLLEAVAEKVIKDNNLEANDIEEVSGGARGADNLGELFAKNHKIKVKVFNADWEKYGRRAGPLRNIQMIDYIKNYKCYVIAFVGEKSRGTRHTFSLAMDEKMPILRVDYKFPDGKKSSLFEGVTIEKYGNMKYND